MHSTLTAIAGSLLLLAASPVAATQCYSGVNIFTARGSFEQPPNGLGIEGTHINAIIAAIPDSNATVIDYPATFANNSVPIGVQNGTRQIQSYLDACPTSKIVVMGYSQGADVQGFVLTGGNFTIAPDGTAKTYNTAPLADKYAKQVIAVVFFGDPQFNINIGINSDAPYPCNVSSDNPRTGAVFESYASRLEEWCNYDDYVCCGTGTSFNGHVSYFSNENGTITANFVAQKYALSGGASSSSSISSSSAKTTPVRPSTFSTRSSVVVASSSASKGNSVSPSSIATKPSTASSPATSTKFSSSALSAPTKVSSVAPGTTAKTNSISKVSSVAPVMTTKSTSTSKAGFPFPTLPFPTLSLPVITLPGFTLPTALPTFHWPI